MGSPLRDTRIAPLGHARAMRSRVSSSGRGTASLTVASWSSSNSKKPGAIEMQRPALTHSSCSIHTFNGSIVTRVLL